MVNEWIIWGLGVFCFAGIIIWYRHSKRETHFLKALIRLIQEQQAQDSPSLRQQQDAMLKVSSAAADKTSASKKLPLQRIPKKFAPLYDQLDQLFLGQSKLNNKDKLTGLPNRLGVKSYLAGLSPLEQGSLVLIDIYRFRFVNDLFGFTVGDSLLKRVSARLVALKPHVLYLARMNEDEFLLHLDTPQTDCELLALREHLQAPYDAEGSTIAIQVQMGVVDLRLFNADVSTLLRRLDLSVIKAKASKPFIAHYAKGDDSTQKRALGIIHHLPKALAQGELYMVYQPKLTVISGEYRQVEALMRWQHFELGNISPAEFIPLMEHAGMIDLVSHWALEQVISQQAKWTKAGISLQVAVNLSTQDMVSETLCEDIQVMLARYHVPATALSIEITESHIMDDMELAVTAINKLKQIGVDVAIDDFGTGHSSLAYLKRFPVDEVKIDKAFLDDLLIDKRAAHIMESSIALAKGLGFSVTVEGVETEVISRALIEMGVDKIQGDYYYKAMTAAEIETKILVKT